MGLRMQETHTISLLLFIRQWLRLLKKAFEEIATGNYQIEVLRKKLNKEGLRFM